MGIEVTCDECSKSTDDVICMKCGERMTLAVSLDETALHDLTRSIMRGDRDAALADLDVLIRDMPDANKLRQRIAIARFEPITRAAANANARAKVAA